MCLTLAVLWAAGVALSAQQYAGPPPPEQPLPFSHKKHLALKLQCQVCHEIPAPGLQAGTPPTSTCMGCHIKEKRDSPFIQQLTEFHRNKESIPWARVYQLPDFVEFSHEAHVTMGKLACETCHGQVQEMDVMRKVTDMSMGACIACHQDRKIVMRCNFCHDPR